MRKISLFLLAALLLGCDRTPVQEFIVKPCCEMGDKIGTVKLRFVKDKVFLVVQNQEILLTTENVPDYYDGVSNLDYSGVLPETQEKIYVHLSYDAKDRLLTHVSIADKPNNGYATNILVPVELPQFSAPDAVQICIDEIQDKVFLLDGVLYLSQDVTYYENRLLGADRTTERQFKLLPYDDAIKISKNWDWKNLGYENIKLYSNMGDNIVVEDWERDACDVLGRLNTYIVAHGYDKADVKYNDEMICANPDVVNLVCFMQSGYRYLTLNMCDNGRYSVRPYNDFHGYELHTGVNDFGATTYVAKAGDREMFTILYQPDKPDGYKYMYQEYNFTGNAYTECYETEPLLEHNLCALNIRSMTRLDSAGAVDVIMSKTYDGKQQLVKSITLTQEQALAVTKNWDYNNMKLYQYGNEPHEKDACDVLYRLHLLKRQLDSTQAW